MAAVVPIATAGVLRTFERLLGLVNRRGPWCARLRSRCWTFRGCTTAGYGRIRHHGRMVRAHRLVWRVLYGTWADLAELDVDHLCRNRACVRPSHLDAVSHDINMRRMARFHAHGGTP